MIWVQTAYPGSNPKKHKGGGEVSQKMEKATHGVVNRSLPWATGFNPTGRVLTATSELSHSEGEDRVFASTLSLKSSGLLLSIDFRAD